MNTPHPSRARSARTGCLAALCALGLHAAAAPARDDAGAARSTTPAPAPASAAAKPAVQGRPLTLSASGHEWASSRFVYRADGKRVSEVLQDFAASQGLPAVMADGIEGLVQANFDARPEDFLDAITKSYGILWYHDGSALYFYPAKAIQSRLFRIKGFSRAQVEELLNSLEIGDRRYPLRYNDAQSTLLVYGPPRHDRSITAEKRVRGQPRRGRRPRHRPGPA